MKTPWQSFNDILTERLIPEYCRGTFFGTALPEFRPTTLNFDEKDAHNFVLAWDAGLIVHIEGGKYRAPRNFVTEKFFNAGPKTAVPRTFRLAQEAVISVATLARLHFEFGWPTELLGTQSVGYAFDVVAFLPGHEDEHIACEVKSTPADFHKLITAMQKFCGGTPSDANDHKRTRAEINAFGKVQGLRSRRAPFFWAVGPCGLSRVFAVSYSADGRIGLSDAAETSLRHPASAE